MNNYSSHNAEADVLGGDIGECLPLDLSAPITRFVTASSVWLLKDREYVRLPRQEKPRVDPERIDPAAFRDGTPMPFRHAAWQVELSTPGWRLHIIPAHQHDGSAGLLTGVVEQSSIAIPPIPNWVHDHRANERDRRTINRIDGSA